MTFFIDANIFLEVQLDQKNAEECIQLLKYLENSDDILWTNSFLIFSMVLTIQYKTGDIDKCKKLITSLNSYKGLRIFNPSQSTVLNALEIQDENKLDFDDALVLSSMDQLNISDIITYDKDFCKIDRIVIHRPLEAYNLLNVKH